MARKTKMMVGREQGTDTPVISEQYTVAVPDQEHEVTPSPSPISSSPRRPPPPYKIDHRRHERFDIQTLSCDTGLALSIYSIEGERHHRHLLCELMLPYDPDLAVEITTYTEEIGNRQLMGEAIVHFFERYPLSVRRRREETCG